MNVASKHSLIKLRKGKATRKHSLHAKIAASVLLKLFLSYNERCHTTDARQYITIPVNWSTGVVYHEVAVLINET